MKFPLRSLCGAWLVCLLLPAGSADGQTRELGEFRQQQAATFNSAGHAKANGLEISLRYPVSWRRGEGARPHVVQNFIAPDVPANCNLLIRDAGPGMTEAQLRAMIQPSQVAAQAPPNAARVRTQATTIDGLPATEMVFESTTNRAGVTLHAGMVIFLTAYRTSMIQLTCLAGATAPAEAAARFEGYHPLFRLIANSLVVHDRWRQSPR